MMNRRGVMRALAGLGTGAGVGTLARFAILAPPARPRSVDIDDLAATVFESLPEQARPHVWLPFDHPQRQYYNRGLPVGGLTVTAASLSWNARRALTDLVAATLSVPGLGRVPQQDVMRLTGVNFKQLLFFGDPRTGPYQAVLSSVHLNLRLGGKVPQRVAFGGPQIYGDQRGDSEVGLPGNVYRYQLASAQRLWNALTPAERTAVRCERAPAQTNIGLQGPGGRFDGLAVADLALPKRHLARDLLAGMLDTYADGAAWQQIQGNGGGGGAALCRL